MSTPENPQLEWLQSLPELGEPLPLSAWYAEPLEAAQARELAAQAQTGLRRVLDGGQDLFASRLTLMIASFWLERDARMLYDSLYATAMNDRERALVDLVYGQLLMSCKLRGGIQRLQRGFLLAASELPPQAYFDVMKRHELLGYLSAGEQRAVPATLDDLLTEAKVIKRLHSGRQKLSEKSGLHQDTLD